MTTLFRCLKLLAFSLFLALVACGSSPPDAATPAQNSSPVAAVPTAPPSSTLGTGLGQLAFVSERDGNSEIYTINVDGTSVTRLTDGNSFDSTPVWSPDGSQLLFTSDRDFNFLQSRLRGMPVNTKLALSSGGHGGIDIYSMNPDGSQVTRLTDENPADDLSPSWSPDGSRIAFASDRGDVPQGFGDSTNIFIMNADGSGVTRQPDQDDKVSDSEPDWSSDGTKIVFTSNRNEGLEIYVTDADGSNATRLTENSDFDFEPTWSPDGTRIAFTSFRDGNLDIVVMDADGSNLTRLTDAPGIDNNPEWSPDGTRIAFSSERGGNLDIYVMDADGSNLVRVTTHPDADSNPAWTMR